MRDTRKFFLTLIEKYTLAKQRVQTMAFWRVCRDIDSLLPRILEFFCGLFLGLGVLGGAIGFFIFEALFEDTILSLLLSAISLCVFIFFAIVAKSLCVLLKSSKAN